MTFKFHCTCGQKVSATEDMIGTKAVCPRCGANMIVPRPEETAEAAPIPAPPSSQKAEEPVALPTEPSPASPAPKRTEPTLAPSPRMRTPSPLSVVPRPVGMLWLTAFLALVAALGAAGYLFRALLPQVPAHAGPVVIGALSALLASLIIALFLKFAVGIVARLNLAYSEAWLVTIAALSLVALAATPAALIQLGTWPVEQGAKFLPITAGASLLLTIIIYSFLVRNALGRPIGVWRGALACVLQVVFLGMLGGIAVLVTVMYSHRT